MSTLSMTTHIGGEYKREHNSRRNPPAHADATRSHENVILERNPAEVYSRLFWAELEAYNATKRPCRQIHDLYGHLKRIYDDAAARDRAIGQGTKYRDKRKCPVKEMIVQFGGVNDTHDQEKEKAALLAYARSFEKRNRNLYLTGVYIHMDEATPHLHLDFISKAKEPAINQLFQRLSFDRALKEMGHTATRDALGRKITPFESWERAERAELQKIALEHGIQTKESVMEQHRAHLDKATYIAKQELNRAEQVKTAAKAAHEKNLNQLATLIQNVPGLLGDIARAVRISQGQEPPVPTIPHKEHERSR